MEALLVLLGLAVAGYVLVVPAIALALSVRASRGRRDLTARVAELERHLWNLEFYVRPPVNAPAAPVVSPLPSPVAAQASAATTPTFAATAEPAATPVEVPATMPAPFEAPASVLASSLLRESVVGAVPSSQVTPPNLEPRPSLEEHLGLTWLTRIGAGAFLLGALFFFKYAVDNAWIGPTGRVGIGCVVGVALLVIAEVIRAKTRPRFVDALVGIGLATLVVSLWASAVFYSLVPSSVAFAATSAVLFLGAALALRYRGEPILVLVLVGGFLNPVILTTGEDRAAELFGYLFLLTAVAHAVALRRSFRFVPWVAILGVVALFGGWYTKFFDASDRRNAPFADVPPSQLVGAYYDLRARVVPLAAVFAFAALWSAVALALRAERAPIRGGEPRASRLFAGLIALAALVVAHAGVTVLLPDSPRSLAIVATALAVGSILLLRHLSSTEFLVVPMAAAFVALLVVSGGTLPFESPSERLLLVGLLGVWTAVYLAGFLRAGERAAEVSRASAVRAAFGSTFFVCLAGVLLFQGQPAIFALIVACASGFVFLLGARSGLRWLGVVAAALAALVLIAGGAELLEQARENASDGSRSFDAGFLAAVALWALVQLAAVGDDSLRRRSPITWTTTLNASVATLGFLAIVLYSTAEDVPTLRALLTAAAGCADLALGTLLLRARGGVPATLLVGQALGLFATSLAFGFSGATVTVLWAALAVVASYIAAQPTLRESRSQRGSPAAPALAEGEPPVSSGDGAVTQRVWLGVAAALFLAALFHVGVDVDSLRESTDRYLVSHGREGTLAPPLLLNSRAYALSGAGVALLLSARVLARVGSFRTARVTAAFMAVVGHALLLALVITEARGALLHLPAAPSAGLDESEWSVFLGDLAAAQRAQQGSLSMITTLLGAAAATALLGAGFLVRDAFHRYLGLALFVLTLGKLALWDVWHVERIYQIALLTGVGGFTVGGGFLYARFGERLLRLLKTGGAAVPPLALLIAFLGVVGDARADGLAASFGSYAQRRSLTGIDARGDYALAVDLDLTRESLSDQLLADVRIAGPDGFEVPYFVEETGAPRPAAVMAARMLDQSVPSEGPVSATWAIDEAIEGRATHCRITLSLEGEGFLRRARLETGEAPDAMTTIAEQAYVYRIRHAGVVVEDAVVTYPPSIASLVRVTLLPDGPGARVAIRGGEVSCTQPLAEQPVELVPLVIESTTRDPTARATILTLDAGDRGLPIRALLLDVRTAEYSRRVDVEATNYRSLWPAAGEALVYRIEPRSGVVLSSARVPLAAVRKRYYRVRIADGDSRSIDVAGVKGEVRARRLVLRAATAGEHVLYVGDALAQAPQYDLADILHRHHGDATLRVAAIGPAVANPDFGVAAAPANAVFTERHRRPLGVALAIVLIGLGLWAVRLLRAKEV